VPTTAAGVVHTIDDAGEVQELRTVQRGVIAGQGVEGGTTSLGDCDPSTDFNLCAPSANTRLRQSEAPRSLDAKTLHHACHDAANLEIVGASRASGGARLLAQAARPPPLSLTGGPLHTRLDGFDILLLARSVELPGPRAVAGLGSRRQIGPMGPQLPTSTLLQMDCGSAQTIGRKGIEHRLSHARPT